MKPKSWYAHGKLMLTGEYLVLKGAQALAFPIKLGQYLSVKNQKENYLTWTAMKQDGLWFQAKMELPGLKLVSSTDAELGERLHELLIKVRSLNKAFLTEKEGVTVETLLEFDPELGLGSSSTLITNLSKWAEIDPFLLQKIAFNGSGYDIACAQLRDPILYRLDKGKPLIEHVSFAFPFANQLYFVYLGNKQQTIASVRQFLENARVANKDISRISALSNELLFCKTLAEFEEIIDEHELIMSHILKQKRVKQKLFADFSGSVKSLGAWGGDFVLMTRHSEEDEFERYLKAKGLHTWYRFNDLLFNPVKKRN